VPNRLEDPLATTASAAPDTAHRLRSALQRTRVAWPLFWNLTVRATRQRYKGSLLGLLWTLVTPLIMVGAYWVVFKFLFGTPIPNYALFMFVGMIAWAVFFSGIQVASNSITQNATLVTKVRFPREIVPFSAMTANALTALAMLVIALPLCLIFPQGMRVTVVMVPVVLIPIFGMTLGLGLLLAGLNVYFRDVEHILTAIGLPWFFLTPIFWTFATVQGTVTQGWVLDLLHWGNPITPGTIALQDALFWGKWPAAGDLIYTLCAAIVFIGVGLWAFRRLKREMAVEL
jgi:ABC-type polysaccharide/polyol phosphate export permease